MNLHAIELKNIVNKYSKSNQVIFCGDFNSQPASELYKIMTKDTFSSAYSLVHGSEPEKTTYCITNRNNQVNTFEGCIDYCFISGINITNANISDFSKPMPNEEWPSDHCFMDFTFLI